MVCTGIVTKVQNKAEHVGDKVGFQWQINRQGEKELGKVLLVRCYEPQEIVRKQRWKEPIRKQRWKEPKGYSKSIAGN